MPGSVTGGGFAFPCAGGVPVAGGELDGEPGVGLCGAAGGGFAPLPVTGVIELGAPIDAGGFAPVSSGDFAEHAAVATSQHASEARAHACRFMTTSTLQPLRSRPTRPCPNSSLDLGFTPKRLGGIRPFHCPDCTTPRAVAHRPCTHVAHITGTYAVNDLAAKVPRFGAPGQWI
jgi:hypothetical protein